ncbi:MAG: DUF4230 domain-containing protein [Lachnospiraceae bacterium]|nr:DUF4230 domain-containing protein [Lachnospiraceae bacterium]
MKKTSVKVIFGVLAIVFVAIMAGVFALRYAISRFDLFSTRTSVSGESISSGFMDIGILNTEEYYFTHVEKYENARELFGHEIPFTESSFIFIYDGCISAGMDFSEIIVDVNDRKKTITLTLPDVYITSFEIDTNSFQLLDEDNSLLNPLSVESLADSISEMEEAEKEKAIEKGILNRAQENAELLVRNFMNGLYEDSGYTLVIQHK